MDYEKILSPVVVGIKPSGIRRFFDIAAEMKDVISLGVGEPDFMTPLPIRQEGIRSLEDGKTKYTANAGLKELRQEIAAYLSRRFHIEYDSLKEVLVTVGGSEAIDGMIRCIITPGDEVLIPEPCFVAYAPLVQICGGTAVSIPTKAEDYFRLTAKTLQEHITSKTKLLVLPFPNNPTGAVMEREHLEEIAQVLRETEIMVMSDEIYGELTYGTDHVSIASLPGMWERTVVISGFSKAFAMTGWRLGYAAGPAPIIQQMTKLHQFAIMSAPTTAQLAAITALRDCEKETAQMRKEYDRRRQYLVKELNRLGLPCFEPKGAFYVFPSIQSTGLTSEDFCEKLLYHKGVAVIPGNAFGDCGEGFVRISYSYSMEHLQEALKRIEEFLREL